MISCNATLKISQANVLKDSETQALGAFLSPFIFSTSSFLEEPLWGTAALQRQQREFVLGKEVWSNKLDACHRECEKIYAGVLSNKRGESAYEAILGDVMKTESS